MQYTEEHSVTKARHIALSATNRLAQIITRLRVIQEALRDKQPKKSGAVLMYLYPCGKDCLGCPHIHWKQWSYDGKKQKNQWLSHAVDKPLMRLPKSKEFQQSRDEIASLMKEAIALEKEREGIVKALSQVNRILR